MLFHVSPWLATVFLGIGAGGLFPLALLLPFQEAESTEETISWSAMMQCGGYLFGALGPVIMGLTVDVFDNFIPALFVLVIIICMMCIVVLKLGNNIKKREIN
ncbi:hypothetical protein [Sporosarcina sp. NPDC096371]|uniref:hypothetical protein n=1 Tax=Sporosarcina sp. NPDC096371 TaxID=3364530 RepID=UPI00382AD983